MMDSLDRPKLLLVEDNRLLRWWMTSSLEHAGFVVAAPETLTEALQICDSCKVDLLVTDWHLRAEGDGFEVLARARRRSPQVFAILISAEADLELGQAARKAGFDLVIQKPFPVAEIVGAVHAYEEKIRGQALMHSGGHAGVA